MQTSISRLITYSGLLGILSLGNLGCSGSNDKAPIITSPSTYIHTENTPFMFTVKAGENAEYQLVYTPDSPWFTLDSSTGALTPVSHLDFEQPHDGDQNNTYHLSINAISQTGRLTTQDLTVTVEDIEEASISIEFPPAGSNIGGFIRQFTVRGIITTANANTLPANHGYTVTVNGVNAHLNPENAMEWTASIAINKGDNPIEATLSKNAITIGDDSLNIVNQPMAQPTYEWATKDGMTYAPSIGRQGIVTLNDDGANATEFLSLAQLKSELPDTCLAIQKLWFADSSNKLFFSCSNNIDRGTAHHLALIDLEERKIIGTYNTAQPPELVIYQNRYAITIQKEYSIDSATESATSTVNDVLIVDLETLQHHELKATLTDIRISEYPASKDERKRFFQHRSFIQLSDTQVIDLDDIILNDGSFTAELETQLSSITIPNRQGVVIDNYIYNYNHSEKGLTRYDLNDNLETTFKLNNLNDQPLEDFSFTIKKSNNDNFVIGDKISKNSWFLNNNDEITLATNDHDFLGITAMTSNADILPIDKTNQLFIFNEEAKELRILNMDNYSTVRNEPLKNYLEDDYSSWAQITYSIKHQKTYKVSHLNWWEPINELTPKVTEIDYLTNTARPLITNQDIMALLEHTDKKHTYVMGDIVFDDLNDRLLAPIYIQGGSDNGRSMVLQYSMQSSALAIITSTDQPTLPGNEVAPWIATPYISNISNDGSFIVFFHGDKNRNFIECPQGCITHPAKLKTLKSQHPFSALLSEDGALLYFNDAIANGPSTSKIYKQDLSRDTPPELISHIGDGKGLWAGGWSISNNKSLFYGLVNNHMVITDIQTGGRVLPAAPQ